MKKGLKKTRIVALCLLMAVLMTVPIFAETIRHSGSAGSLSVDCLIITQTTAMCGATEVSGGIPYYVYVMSMAFDSAGNDLDYDIAENENYRNGIRVSGVSYVMAEVYLHTTDTISAVNSLHRAGEASLNESTGLYYVNPDSFYWEYCEQ